MPWIRFTRDFDYSPPEKGGRVTIAYRAGTVANVTRACADAAMARGAGQPSARPHGASGKSFLKKAKR